MFCKILTLHSVIVLANFASTVVTEGTSVVGSTVEMKCQYQATSSHPTLFWIKAPLIVFSSNDKIYLNSYPDIKKRVTITGNHIMGEYHLSISDVKKIDAGTYECAVGSNKETHQLTVVEGPQSVSFAGKTQHNQLLGTEDQDLTISCTAVGGDPAPDMVLQIRNKNYTTKSSARTTQYTIPKVGRSYDGGTVKCMAGYQSISYFPVKETATVYLYLKPSIQSVSPDPVVTVETKPLSVTCISAGGRPKPTIKWTIDNADITTHSAEVSSTHDTATDTHAVTSALTYSVDRNYNGKTIACGFKNEATGNSYVSMSRNLDVKFSPSVAVDNKTFNPNDISRQISCAALGNPADYTYFFWQHKSMYDKLIRILDKNSTLTLPPVSEDKTYQDTGEYICTVSNGIKDKNGNINQQGSGFVTSQAKPVILSGLNQINYGQLRRDVQIQVKVYSEPTYSSLKWLKGSREILSSSKYTMTDAPDVMIDTFHGTKVQVDGYKLTLTIHDLEVEDFVNYTLRLTNGVGQTVEHVVILMSASAPDPPKHILVINQTDRSITVQWEAGNDGGFEQTFFILYKPHDSSIWVTLAGPTSVIGSNPLFDTKIEGLKDSTKYEIKMFAENKIDKSAETLILTGFTNIKSNAEYVTNLEHKANILTGVTTGLSIITVISVVIIAVLVNRLLTNKRNSKRTANRSISKDSTQTTDFYDNVRDTKENNLEIDGRNYDTLRKKDHPNTYEALGLSTKEHKADIDGRNYETLGTKDQANVYEALGQSTHDGQSKLYSNTTI